MKAACTPLLSVALTGATILSARAAPEDWTRVSVYPEAVSLTSRLDGQRLIVQGVKADHSTHDLTASATVTAEDPSIILVEDATIVPAADGATRVWVETDGHRMEVSVQVTGAATERPVRFKLDVLPVLTKAGCNAGSCHGSARGQDGFLLSLFGFDPDRDYFRLTREMSGRRINLAVPEDSLLLQKATGAVPHTGGECFTPDSEWYRTVLAWLNAAAPKDPDTMPTVTGIEIAPRRMVLAGPGAGQQLLVRAQYSDGTDRDVSDTTVFIGNNDTCATVSPLGAVTAHQRGEVFVTARYDRYTVGSEVIVVPAVSDFEFPDLAEVNYIDTAIHEKLRKLRIAPSDLCTDAEFLRRAYLDIIGQLPPAERVTPFLEDPDPAKRDRLVEELIARPAFVDLWVMQWAELLQIRSNREFSYKSAYLYHQWLRDRLNDNQPISEIARQILTAKGSTFQHPPASYYQLEKDPLLLAEKAAQVFTGIRLQCAQCHNHPFDRWTMDDYYGFASFFSRIGVKRAGDPREYVVFPKGSGDVKHPVGGGNTSPRFLGGEEPKLPNGGDRREALADWLTSPENPYFARNIANRVWAHFFGMGIVEPVDDVRISNPPSNPELLNALAGRLVEYGYDLRRMVRDICTSRTYQLSTRSNHGNAHDTRNFARARIRRIRAEILLDCISQVTETPEKLKGLPLGARAVEIADGNTSTYFLTTFGRATRDTVCSCEVVMEPNLSQALHLLNGDTIHQKLRESGAAKSLLNEYDSPAAAIRELYLRCLARPPTDVEQTQLAALIEERASPEDALEDVFWSLLNAKEFVFNH